MGVRLFSALTASLLLAGVAPAVAAADQVSTVTATLTLSATQAPTSGVVTATITSTSPDSPITGYTVDFGDGTAPVQTTATTVQHAYASTGDFHANVTATDAAGDTSTPGAPADIRVVPPAPLVPRLVVTAVGLEHVHVDTSGSTDSWNITNVTCDFGDGTGRGPCDSHDVGGGNIIDGTRTITVAAIDAGGNEVMAHTQFTAPGSYFNAFGPTRLVDTRLGTGAPKREVAANTVVRMAVPASIPADVTALALNLTATGETGAGYVTAYADGTARPAVSTLNFVAGRAIAVTSLVAPGADRSVDVFVHGNATDLVIDITGYFERTFGNLSGGILLRSGRLLDTRSGTGTGTSPLGSNGPAHPVPPGGTVDVNVGFTTEHGLEGANLLGAVIDVVATDPTAAGFLTVYPDNGGARPITSTVNFVRGQTVANSVFMATGRNGGFTVYNGSSGTVEVVADFSGWFGSFNLDAYAPVTPYRAFDNRQGSPLPPRTSVRQSVPAKNGLAPSADAVVMNMTVTNTRAAGFLAVTGDPTPATTSAVNWSAGQTIANLAVTQAGTTPSVVSLFNGSDGTTDAIGDVVGYFGQ